MNQQYPFKPIPLSYGYVSFSPYADPDTMYLHHNQYYQKKVNELNQLVVQHRLTDLSLEELLNKKINLPAAQAERLKNVAGAVYNHELFFDGLKGRQGKPPLNRLVGVLIAVYGSMERFKRLLFEAAGSLPGVGWVWLVTEKNGGPHIVMTENHEVVMLDAVQPILILDMWEHAYFLDDQFDLEKYIDAWFSFIDWDKANARFQNAHIAL